MNVTLAQMRAFVAVHEARGFSAAADETGTTQAALSYAVGSLEKTIGGKVFDRQPRLALTALGAKLLPHALASVTAADRVGLIVDVHFGRAAGTVRVAASTTACAGVVPQLLDHWGHLLPGIEVRILEGEDDEMPAWLEDGIVDAAILIDPEERDGRAVVVARDKFEAVVRGDHPFAGSNSITVADLLDDPVVVSDTGCRARILDICRSADPGFTPARDIRELSTVMELVAAGVGVSILPGLGHPLVPEGLTLIPLEPAVHRTLVLTGPTGRPWRPLAEELVASVKEPTSSRTSSHFS
ncbi:MAG: LysR family transcriptional regulator [Microbacterium sp.]